MKNSNERFDRTSTMASKIIDIFREERVTNEDGNFACMIVLVTYCLSRNIPLDNLLNQIERVWDAYSIEMEKL